MQTFNKPVTFLSSFLQRYFLWLLLGSYVAAALAPGFGLWLRDVSFGEVHLFQQQTRVSLTMLMLAVLLLNAGLGIQPARLKILPRFWLVIVVGLVANLLVPVAYIFLATPLTGIWLDDDDVQNILLGLALIASMPIAGSSTAWAQNAGGNMALSLGLVVLSTLLSPLTTPVILRLVGLLASGDHADDLRRLTAHSTGVFLIVCVIVPSGLGIFLSWALGPARLATARPHLKLVTWVNLLLLIYANASVCLPDTIAYPDVDFLRTAVGITVALCVLSFGSGWLTAHLLGTDTAQRVSLMFGLGMNNNGTGLVLASVALTDYPSVLLPIIIYNLAQHLVAGLVASVLLRRTSGQAALSANPEVGSVK